MLRYHLICSLLFGALSVAAIERSIDPENWRPPAQHPQLTSRLDAKTFQERLKAAQARMAEDDRKKANRINGVFVIRTTAGGIADKLGIKKGDYITSIDGRPLSRDSVFKDMRTDVPQKIEVVTPGNPVRTLQIPPGKIGVIIGNLPEYTVPFVFKATPLDPRWKNELELVARTFEIDGELAQKMLIQAYSKGLKPTAETDFIAGAIALNEGRLDEALAFGWYSIQADKKGPGQELFYTAAVCSHRPRIALSVVDESEAGVQRRKYLEDVISAFNQRPANEKKLILPSVKARNYARDSLLLRAEPELEGVGDYTLKDTPARIDAMLKDGKDSFGIMTEHHRDVAFGPFVRNVHLSARFRLKPSDNAEVSSQRKMKLGPEFRDPADKKKIRGDDDLCGVVITDDYLQVFYPELLTCMRRYTRGAFSDMTNPAEHSIDIYLLDGELEINYDGSRIFYGSMSKNDSLYRIFYNVSGMSVSFSEFQSEELLTRDEWQARMRSEINRQFRLGWTRAHFLAVHGTKDEILELSAFKPDWNLCSSEGETPLQLAVRRGKFEIARTIVSAGAPVDISSAAALSMVDELGKAINVYKNDPKKNINVSNTYWSVMHGAVLSDDPNVLKMLVAAGVNIDVRTTNVGKSQTPLMWAAANGKLKAAEFLLSTGASVNELDIDKHTALWYAEQSGNSAMIQLLKKHNAVRDSREPVRPPAPPPFAEF